MKKAPDKNTITPAGEEEKRVVPTTAAEKDAALAPYKFPVNTGLKLVSLTFGALNVRPLEEGEIEEGTEIISGVMYEENIPVSYKMLLLGWLGVVITPRYQEWKTEREKEGPSHVASPAIEKRAEEHRASLAPPAPAEVVKFQPPVIQAADLQG